MNLLTVNQVADRLACKPDTIRAHIAAKRLRAFDIGTKSQRIWRVSEEDLVAFLDQNVQTPSVPLRIPRRATLKYLKDAVN